MTAEHKYTPGPWDIFPVPGKPGKITIGPVESHSNLVRQVAECFYDDVANANLIAAAPDLLAACKAAKDCEFTTGKDTLGKLAVAIKKAEVRR